MPNPFKVGDRINTYSNGGYRKGKIVQRVIDDRLYVTDEPNAAYHYKQCRKLKPKNDKLELTSGKWYINMDENIIIKVVHLPILNEEFPFHTHKEMNFTWRTDGTFGSDRNANHFLNLISEVKIEKVK